MVILRRFQDPVMMPEMIPGYRCEVDLRFNEPEIGASVHTDLAVHIYGHIISFLPFLLFQVLGKLPHEVRMGQKIPGLLPREDRPIIERFSFSGCFVFNPNRESPFL